MYPRPVVASTWLLAVAITALPGCGSSPEAPSTPPTTATPPQTPAVDPCEVDLTHAIQQANSSAVALEYYAGDAPATRRVASGVVVSAEGDVLSVRIDAPRAASPIIARVASGRRLEAHWVASDPETGLTLLKLEPGAAPPAVPAPRGARVGIPVLVVGNPFGLGHSVSRGYVSGLDRRLEIGPRQLGGLIQVDAALHPGDSGALLADQQGGWIGVVRSGLASPAEGASLSPSTHRVRELDHDLGFAIPTPDALWVADQLRARRRVDRAYLGVMMDHAPPAGVPEGAVLGRVLADTPAERAGLKPGDRVVAIDGRPVRSPYDLTDRLDRTPADARIVLDLVRLNAPAQKPERLSLATARRPPFEPSKPAPEPVAPRPDDPAELAKTIERLERRIRELEKHEPSHEARAQH